jgi:hypothetical protein
MFPRKSSIDSNAYSIRKVRFVIFLSNGKEVNIDKLIEKLYKEKHYIFIISERILKEQKEMVNSSEIDKWIKFANKLRHYCNLAEIEFANLNNEIENKFRMEESIIEFLKEELIQELRDCLIELNLKFSNLYTEPDNTHIQKMKNLLEEMSDDEDEENNDALSSQTDHHIEILTESIRTTMEEEIKNFNEMRKKRSQLIRSNVKENSMDLGELRGIRDISEISGKEIINSNPRNMTPNLCKSLSKR